MQKYAAQRNQSGQALLIVVLIMVVALTVGLSVAARSIVSLRVATEEVNTQKAFSAAEAAIEQAIQNPSNAASLTGKSLGNGAIIKSVSVAQLIQDSNSQILLNNGLLIPQDQGADVWLTKFSSNPSQLYGANSAYSAPWSGNLTIYWASDACVTTQAALEVVIITGSRSTPVTNRYPYDPCSSRQLQNNFLTVPTDITPLSPAKSIQGQKFSYKVTIPVSKGLIARITPLYAGSVIAIETDTQLPPQGQIVTATGVSSSDQSNATARKLLFYQSFDSLPAEIFYGMFIP